MHNSIIVMRGTWQGGSKTLLTIIRILIGLIQAILKVFADAVVRGGAALLSALLALGLIAAALWLVILFAVSLSRRLRSR